MSKQDRKVGHYLQAYVGAYWGVQGVGFIIQGLFFGVPGFGGGGGFGFKCTPRKKPPSSSSQSESSDPGGLPKGPRAPATIRGYSGDTTPCEITPVILHGDTTLGIQPRVG